MAARIVIVCPERWSENTVNLLAARLLNTELPECVGVEVHGLTFMESVLREASEDDV